MTEKGATIEAGASLGRPASLVPARSGGEWDGPPTPVRASEVDRGALEAAEDAAWEDPDADDPGPDLEASLGETSTSPEATEPSEDSTPPESTDEEPAAAEPESTPEEPTRFQSRISELVDARKQAEAERDAVQTRLAQLLAAQEQTAQLQAEFLRAELAKRRESEELARQRQALEELRAEGYNLQDPSTWDLLEAKQVAREAKMELTKLREEQETARREASYRRYEAALETSLDETLRSIGVEDASLRSTLFESAYAIAQAKQLANPGDAVKAAVGPLLPVLKTAAKKAPKKPPTDPKVEAVISTPGRAAGGKAGTNASGKPARKGVDDLEREFGAGGGW